MTNTTINHTQAERPSFGVERQMNIYLNGLFNRKNKFPVSYEALLQEASEKMTPEAFAYIAGGAGGETTMRNNQEALDAWQIVPRMLVDISDADMGVTLFGQRLPSPLLLGPVGVLSIAHPDAELPVARAARSLKVPQIVSTVSSMPMEDIARENGDNPHWFQLYWGRDHDFTRSIINRAEQAGYSALVVTLDTPVLAWRERDIKLGYLPFLHGDGLANYFSDPVFRKAVGGDPGQNKFRAIRHFTRVFTGPGLTWNDLSVIRNCTSLPVILKGIQHVDDARKALDFGVDGIVVSNHGGRQVDGAVGSLTVLPEIANAVGDELTVLFDSGIRRGADVFKAMALGAKAVCIARPYALALGIGGEAGVREVVSNLMADVELTMGLAGCRSWQDVSINNLRRK